MPPETAVRLIETVVEFLVLIVAGGLVAAAIAAAWRLWRGVPLPPEERRRPHYMGEGAAAPPPLRDIPIKGKPRRRLDLGARPFKR